MSTVPLSRKSTLQVVGTVGGSFAPLDPTSWTAGQAYFARKGMALVNVEDAAYGAVNDSNGTAGNGTDNTTAIRAAITAARGLLSNGWAATVGIVFPASKGTGSYRVTGELWQQPDAAGATVTQIPGLHWIGASRRASEIFFDTSATVSSDPTLNNLFVLPNVAYGWTFERMSFLSVNSAHNCFYFWSTGGAATKPAYGKGYNRDITWIDCEWRGSWNRGIGLDGDSTANLNSEMNWVRCKMSSASSGPTVNDNPLGTIWGDAFLTCGITAVASNSQQDQFVNYSFADCLFEYRNGTLLKFPAGGEINIRGGSWVAANTVNASTYVSLPNPGRAHNDGCMRLLVDGTRFEARSANCKIINSQWTKGVIAFISVDDSALSFQGFAATANTHLYDFNSGNPNNRGPIVRYVNCTLMGFHQVNTGASVPTQGSITYDDCRFFNNHGITDTGTATGFVQYTTSKPGIKFRNCWQSDATQGVDTPISAGTAAAPLSIVNGRADSAANWTSANPTLGKGEAGWELPANSATTAAKLKIGDGATAWTALAYTL